MNNEIMIKKDLIGIVYMQIIILHRRYATKENETEVFVKSKTYVFLCKTKNAVKLVLVFWGYRNSCHLTLFSNSIKKCCSVLQYNLRRIKNYSNDNINKEKSHLNYSSKNPRYSYEKEFDIEYKYKHKIKTLEKENNQLHKIVDKFYDTVEKFIKWICHKFGIGESKELVKNFEEDTNTLIDLEKQLNKKLKGIVKNITL